MGRTKCRGRTKCKNWRDRGSKMVVLLRVARELRVRKKVFQQNQLALRVVLLHVGKRLLLPYEMHLNEFLLTWWTLQSK